MKKFIDITNQKFGRLTVIKRAINNKQGTARWECLCECGKITITESNKLRKNKTVSCLTCANRKKGDLQKNGNLLPLLQEDNKSYYMAGFLLADGCIYHKTNRLSLALGIEDEDYLKWWAQQLSTNISNTSYLYKPTNKIVRSCSIRIQERDLIPQFINKFDFKPRKTYNPPDIDKYQNWTKEQKLSLLIGFIDGDGHIDKYKHITIVNHISWKSVHEWFGSVLSNDNWSLGKKYDKKYNSYYSAINIYCSNFPVLLNHIEKYNLPILKRKWYQ